MDIIKFPLKMLFSIIPKPVGDVLTHEQLFEPASLQQGRIYLSFSVSCSLIAFIPHWYDYLTKFHSVWQNFRMTISPEVLPVKGINRLWNRLPANSRLVLLARAWLHHFV